MRKTTKTEIFIFAQKAVIQSWVFFLEKFRSGQYEECEAVNPFAG
jgi:hypothetical protein